MNKREKAMDTSLDSPESKQRIIQKQIKTKNLEPKYLNQLLKPN
jgi:hypothetical protein